MEIEDVRKIHALIETELSNAGLIKNADIRATKEYDVAWDILVDRCQEIFQVMRTFTQFDEIKKTNVRIEWRIKDHKFIDLGTIIICKLDSERTEMIISGVPSDGFIKVPDLGDEEGIKQRIGYEMERAQREARQKEVVENFFNYLSKDAVFMPESLLNLHVNAAKREKPKQVGRYRLTDQEIKFRRLKVKEANKIKKSNPQRQWKEIDKQFADELNISDRTFRSWRHNNY